MRSTFWFSSFEKDLEVVRVERPIRLPHPHRIHELHEMPSAPHRGCARSPRAAERRPLRGTSRRHRRRAREPPPGRCSSCCRQCRSGLRGSSEPARCSTRDRDFAGSAAYSPRAGARIVPDDHVALEVDRALLLDLAVIRRHHHRDIFFAGIEVDLDVPKLLSGFRTPDALRRLERPGGAPFGVELLDLDLRAKPRRPAPRRRLAGASRPASP